MILLPVLRAKVNFLIAVRAAELVIKPLYAAFLVEDVVAPWHDLHFLTRLERLQANRTFLILFKYLIMVDTFALLILRWLLFLPFLVKVFFKCLEEFFVWWLLRLLSLRPAVSRDVAMLAASITI